MQADEESAETNRMMGLALQGQGQLDMAFDRFRRVPHGRRHEQSVQPGLDFETRQFNKAEAVYRNNGPPTTRTTRRYPGQTESAKNPSETVMRLVEPAGILVAPVPLDGGAVGKLRWVATRLRKSWARGQRWSTWARTPRSGAWWPSRPLALSQEFQAKLTTDA